MTVDQCGQLQEGETQIFESSAVTRGEDRNPKIVRGGLLSTEPGNRVETARCSGVLILDQTIVTDFCKGVHDKCPLFKPEEQA